MRKIFYVNNKIAVKYETINQDVNLGHAGQMRTA